MKKLDHILVLTPFFSPNVGGVETYLDDFCDVLLRRGYHVYVLTYQPLSQLATAPALEKKERFLIRRLTWFGRKKDFFHKLHTSPALQFLYLTPYLSIYSFFFLLRHPGIQVIHAQGVVASFIGKFLKFFFRKKLIVNIQAVYDQKVLSPLNNALIKFILKSSDHTFIPAEIMRDQLVRLYGLPNDKVTLFRYWMDFSKFFPLQPGEAKPMPEWKGKFVVLFIGRLLEIKGVDLIYDIAPKFSSDVLFVIIGEGARRDQLAERAKAHSNISFLGPVTNTGLRKFYVSADLLLMPSLYEEGYGRVNMEALSCGIPVVASNRGGIGEVLKEDTALLVPPSVENFTNAIETLKNDPARLAAMKKNAVAFVQKNFSENNIQVHLDAYTL